LGILGFLRFQDFWDFGTLEILGPFNLCMFYTWFMREQTYSFDFGNSEGKRRHKTGGLCIAGTFAEIKAFAFEHFDKLDKDGDGFISRNELKASFEDQNTSQEARSYIFFLLRRIDEIQAAYNEEWGAGDGISRADIQEYFKTWIEKVQK